MRIEHYTKVFNHGRNADITSANTQDVKSLIRNITKLRRKFDYLSFLIVEDKAILLPPRPQLTI